MSQDHTLMASRYELKYLIPERTALKVRQFVQQHLEVDEFGVGQPNLSYPVHSLYLDSDDWKIYWRTINGDKNRFKLRVRYYNESPKTPVFFEIKRRMKDIILKQRCGIRRHAAAGILAGLFPDRKDIASRDPEEHGALQRFMELMLELDARPKMHVFYMREAYVNDRNNEFRVTLDRGVKVCPRLDGQLVVHQENPYDCTDDGTVILELKFTNRFPNWYRDLVQMFHLVQTGAAKYVEGTTMHRDRFLHPRDAARSMVLD